MTRPTLAQLLRWLTSITRPVHKPLYVSTIFRFINLGLELCLFGVAGWGVIAALQGQAVLPILLALVAISITKAVAFYLEQFTGHYVAFKALELLRGHAFSKMWPKAPGNVIRNRSGDLLTSLTRDVDRIEVVYAHTFAPVVSAFVVPTSALIIVGATVGWSIVMIPAICLLLSLLVVPMIGFRTSLAHTDRSLAVRGDLTAHVTDSVFGVEEVVGYGREVQRRDDMDELGESVSHYSVVAARSRGLRRGANIVLTLTTVASIFAVGLGGDYSVAIVCGLAVAGLRFFEGPRGIEDAVGSLDRSFAAAHRLYEICHESERVSDGTDALELADAPSIAWQNVTYRYPGETVDDTLKDVSVDVPAGTRAAFVGVSGSGKTTTVQLLMRYDDPDTGNILINGVPVRSYTLDSLRAHTVLVSQRNQLLDTTIAENLRLGKPDATEDELWEVLKVAHIDSEIRSMPEGLNTRVGQDGAKLSGGQGQRVCLARALLMRPKILILDEFTANLNVGLEENIRQSLHDHMGAMTIIEVTHRLEAARTADQVVLFDRGRVVAAGDPQSVLGDRGETIPALS